MFSGASRGGEDFPNSHQGTNPVVSDAVRVGLAPGWWYHREAHSTAETAGMPNTCILSAVTLVPEEGHCSGQGLSCGSLFPSPGRRHETAGLPSVGGGLWGAVPRPRTQPREDWAGRKAGGQAEEAAG